MISRVTVCVRIGLLTGFWVGLLLARFGEPAFAGAHVHPPLSPLEAVLAGIVAGTVFALLAGLLHVAFFSYPARPIVIVALILGIIIGSLIGPIAFAVGVLWVACLIGSLLGAVIGWLVCWILCGHDWGSFLRDTTHVQR